jgi:hypothetical protein
MCVSWFIELDWLGRKHGFFLFSLFFVWVFITKLGDLKAHFNI